MQPRTEVEHSAGKPRTITPPLDRQLKPAHGAIIVDALAGVRCLVIPNTRIDPAGGYIVDRPGP